MFFSQQSPIPNHYFCPNYVFIPWWEKKKKKKVIIVPKYRLYFKCLRIQFILNFAYLLLNKCFKAKNYLPTRNQRFSLSWGNCRYNKWWRNTENQRGEKNESWLQTKPLMRHFWCSIPGLIFELFQERNTSDIKAQMWIWTCQ